MLESGKAYHIIRVYFNHKSDYPLVWSVDDGDQANEHKTKRVVFDTLGSTAYNWLPRNDLYPVAWVEFYNVILDIWGETVGLTAVRKTD